MKQMKQPFRIRNRITILDAVVKEQLRDGNDMLASSYQGAADALSRGDEIAAQLWLEKADAQRQVKGTRSAPSVALQCRLTNARP